MFKPCSDSRAYSGGPRLRAHLARKGTEMAAPGAAPRLQIKALTIKIAFAGVWGAAWGVDYEEKARAHTTRRQI
jgi:hypothetical protein